VDETGIDTCLHREYARSARGRPVAGVVSGRKFRRCSIVAAQMDKRVIEPLQYDGTMDSQLFEAWFAMRLLPSLPECTTIVMDNAAFHRKSRLLMLASNYGHSIVFLPPYSPELNHIENFWSWLKRYIKK
jgi:transposase